MLVLLLFLATTYYCCCWSDIDVNDVVVGLLDNYGIDIAVGNYDDDGSAVTSELVLLYVVPVVEVVCALA
jgi:hypothetical protein